ncbi:Noranthrone synthase [Lecanosticta acicola]|uniref:Noranthrone synthase n=1 Tax=Lecanosticta acicola TaxID=111012 RepID=A0AAI9E8E1_9PEZI|nr:Noranthrone synthase [Lecanosticta acicola]
MASDETMNGCFRIIGEAISVEPEDFQDHETWHFLGLKGLLASATASDLKAQTDVKDIPDDVFEKFPTVGAFRAFLKGDSSSPSKRKDDDEEEPANPWDGIPKPKVPLSIILQGKPETSHMTVFLFPDGSGAGGSYLSLPPVGDGICLIGLNSPFLRQAQNFTCSIPRMARLWLDEVRKLQPKSQPYILGGWSAGGFYCYEVAKLLTHAGQRVDRLILIDSPCRYLYEALPAQVVDELTRNGLMGASGEKKAPEWLVQHFTSTVLSVDKYWPEPFTPATVPPQIHFIWVREGLVRSVPESGLKVDLNVKVTRFLLEPRGDLQSEGWERLLPGARMSFDYMTGNHFQITQAPHSHSLAKLLAKVLAT